MKIGKLSINFDVIEPDQAITFFILGTIVGSIATAMFFL